MAIGLKFLTTLIVATAVLVVGGTSLGLTIGFSLKTFGDIGRQYAKDVASLVQLLVNQYIVEKEATMFSAGYFSLANNVAGTLPSQVKNLYPGSNWTDVWLPHLLHESMKVQLEFSAYTLFFVDGYWMYSSKTRSAQNGAGGFYIDWIELADAPDSVPFTDRAASVGGLRWYSNLTEWPYDETSNYQPETLFVNAQLYPFFRPNLGAPKRTLAALTRASSNKLMPQCTWLGSPNFGNHHVSGVYWENYGVCDMKNASGDVIGYGAFGLGITRDLEVKLREFSGSRNGFNFLIDSDGFIQGTSHWGSWWSSRPAVDAFETGDPGCSNSGGFGNFQNLTLGCRLPWKAFTAYRPLTVLSLDFVATDDIAFMDISVEGKKYYVHSERINAGAGGYKVNVVSFVPEDDLDVDKFRNSFYVAIGLCVVVFFVGLALALAVLHFTIKRLQDVQTKMEAIANLENLDPEEDFMVINEDRVYYGSSDDLGGEREESSGFLVHHHSNRHADDGSSSDGDDDENNKDGDNSNNDKNRNKISSSDDGTENVNHTNNINNNNLQLIPTASTDDEENDNSNNNNDNNDNSKNYNGKLPRRYQPLTPQEIQKDDEQHALEVISEFGSNGRNNNNNNSKTLQKKNSFSTNNNNDDDDPNKPSAVAVGASSSSPINSPSSATNKRKKSVRWSRRNEIFLAPKDGVTQGRNYSIFSEIAAVEKAYEATVRNLVNFTRYVPKTVVSELIAQRKFFKANSGPEASLAHFDDVTVSFCEIAQFSKNWDLHYERRDALCNMLFVYYKRICRLILGHGCVTDKFLADNVCFYSHASEHHALLSVLCALAIQREASRNPLHNLWMSTLKVPLQVRCGIFSGRAHVGSVGTKDRLNYTVIGAPVIHSKVLTTLNSTLSTKVLVDHNCVLNCKDAICFRLVTNAFINSDMTEPVYLYEPFGLDVDSDLVRQRVLARLGNIQVVKNNNNNNNTDSTNLLNNSSSGGQVVSVLAGEETLNASNNNNNKQSDSTTVMMSNPDTACLPPHCVAEDVGDNINNNNNNISPVDQIIHHSPSSSNNNNNNNNSSSGKASCNERTPSSLQHTDDKHIFASNDTANNAACSSNTNTINGNNNNNNDNNTCSYRVMSEGDTTSFPVSPLYPTAGGSNSTKGNLHNNNNISNSKDDSTTKGQSLADHQLPQQKDKNSPAGVISSSQIQFTPDNSKNQSDSFNSGSKNDDGSGTSGSPLLSSSSAATPSSSAASFLFSASAEDARLKGKFTSTKRSGSSSEFFSSVNKTNNNNNNSARPDGTDLQNSNNNNSDIRNFTQQQHHYSSSSSSSDQHSLGFSDIMSAATMESAKINELLTKLSANRPLIDNLLHWHVSRTSTPSTMVRYAERFSDAVRSCIDLKFDECLKRLTQLETDRSFPEEIRGKNDALVEFVKKIAEAEDAAEKSENVNSSSRVNLSYVYRVKNS